jgi:putative transposase
MSSILDGKGRYSDNIFVERFWRTMKYREVCFKDYTDRRQTKTGIESYFHFYNKHRPNQTMAYRTPAGLFNGESDEKSTERKWSASRALAGPGKTAGISLNIAPNLSN